MLDKNYLQKIFTMMRESTDDITKEKNFLVNCRKEICNWINERQPIKKEYVKILNENPDELGLIAEIGTGVLDSLTFFIKSNTQHDIIVISEYADTFNNIEAYNPRLLSNSECNELDNEIKTVMLQLPCKKEELMAVISLFNSDKNLYIGSYGLSSDKNKTKNKEKINFLYDGIKILTNREVKLHEFENDQYYYSAVEVCTTLKKEKLKIKEYDVDIEEEKYKKLEYVNNSRSR